jgi:hypothetical protein
MAQATHPGRPKASRGSAAPTAGRATPRLPLGSALGVEVAVGLLAADAKVAPQGAANPSDRLGLELPRREHALDPRRLAHTPARPSQPTRTRSQGSSQQPPAEHPHRRPQRPPETGPPNPARSRSRRATLSGSAGQLAGWGTASPAAPRPGPCTRPRTGRCRGRRPDPTAPGRPPQGRCAVLRTGLRPPLTRPPAPRAATTGRPPGGRNQAAQPRTPT